MKLIGHIIIDLITLALYKKTKNVIKIYKKTSLLIFKILNLFLKTLATRLVNLLSEY